MEEDACGSSGSGGSGCGIFLAGGGYSLGGGELPPNANDAC